MGITKEFSSSLYSSIYHMGYDKIDCDPELRYCLCPALHDYNDSCHLCKCAVETNYKERISYHSKEGKRIVKAEGTDEMCCKQKRPEQRVDLFHGIHACDAAKQLTEFGVEKGQFITEVISWQITEAFHVNDMEVDFWTLYCAFHPKCLMFDICNIVYALFECIKYENESEKWLVVLRRRLDDYLKIYHGRKKFEEQYKIILGMIYSKLCESQVSGFSLNMFKKGICNALQQKTNCEEPLSFLVISSAGKRVFLDALESLLVVTGRYLSEWNAYGFKKNGSLAADCSTLLKEYTDSDLHNHAVSRYGKFGKLEPADKHTAVLNAGNICHLVDQVMRHCQVRQYWTKM